MWTPENDNVERELRLQASRRRRSKRLLIGLFILLPFLPFAWFIQKLAFPHLFDTRYELSDDEKEAARAKIAALRKRGDAEEQAMRAALEAGVAKLGPDPERPCKYQPPVRERTAGVDPGWGGSAFTLFVTRADELHVPAVGTDLRARADRLEADLDREMWQEYALISLREDIAALDTEPIYGLPYEVVFVESLRRAPVVMGGAPGVEGSFEAGLVIGRAYLLERATNSVACVGDVMASNSDNVKFEYTTYGPGDLGSSQRTAAAAAIGRDLDVELERAVARAMRAVADAPSSFVDFDRRTTELVKRLDALEKNPDAALLPEDLDPEQLEAELERIRADLRLLQQLQPDEGAEPDDGLSDFPALEE